MHHLLIYHSTFLIYFFSSTVRFLNIMYNILCGIHSFIRTKYFSGIYSYDCTHNTLKIIVWKTLGSKIVTLLRHHYICSHARTRNRFVWWRRIQLWISFVLCGSMNQRRGNVGQERALYALLWRYSASYNRVNVDQACVMSLLSVSLAFLCIMRLIVGSSHIL
mgnify:CR=1 FL=1